MKNLIELNGETEIIENISMFDLNSIENGILIIYSEWSVPAISNSKHTLKMLKERNYLGKVLLIDIDIIPYDFQINILGQVCQGWSELFVIEKGNIINKFLGKDSYIDFVNSFTN